MDRMFMPRSSVNESHGQANAASVNEVKSEVTLLGQDIKASSCLRPNGIFHYLAELHSNSSENTIA